ncbi:MAG: 5'-nucleotidase [Halobacteriovoraceae bacterium]|nr:5'-nucleotidase [Halobacteriovoraceae bacterium]MBC96575.1 5'-nucleotidase [Halobacteriovoraceae bacterium]|tara:strand:- start:114600 stop:115994 length:1395 start_codon:yes stop_codon:yes gene_type:complete
MTVFINRTINLKKIKAIGLDMDYTIVRYNTEAFEELTHKEVLAKLVSLKNYPEKIKTLKFEFERSIQGLVIDKKRGHLLKISRYGKVKEAYHGLEPLDFKTQQDIYANRIIDLALHQFQSLDTSFSISNGVLYSQLVQLKREGMELPDFYNLADDIKEILDICHGDGTIKDQVREDLERFIIKDKEIVHLLERYKDYGKQLIVITNSDYNYTKLLLDYAINPFLENHKDWSELFDITITLSRKPAFFTNEASFLKIDLESGLMSNHFGKVESGVYQGGSAHKLQKDLGLNGEEILYLGDHIYGDVVSIKKTFNWRTALILDPLKDELNSIKKSSSVQKKIDKLMGEKQDLEYKINEIEIKKFEARKNKTTSDEVKAFKEELNKVYAQIEKINTEISDLITEYRSHFNPYWGELMRAGQEESRMADQVEKYACLYMIKISDLFSHSPRTYFRPEKRILPHEVENL